MPRHLTRTLLLALATLAVALPAAAGPASDALGACLSDNTTGRDRKELARWVFIAMSSHPEMADLSGATPESRTRANQAMGRLVTKLLAEDCAAQARAAVAEGGNAMQSAFASLGRLAMQELMSNPAVQGAISGFEVYADKAKVQSALLPK